MKHLQVHFADGSPLVEIAPSFSDIEQENPSPSGNFYITLRLKLILFDLIYENHQIRCILLKHLY